MKTNRPVTKNDKTPPSPRIHPAMRPFVGYCMAKIAFQFRARMDEGLAGYGIVAPQCGMMALLHKVGPMTQIELGGYLAIDKATMVRFLDDLEEKKWLVRVTDPKDRRAKVLQLTKAGEKTLAGALKVKDAIENEMLGVLTKAERETFAKLIAKIALQGQDEKA